MHNYYITPEEYEIAERNGISQATLNARVRRLNWDKKRAINTPVLKYANHKKWLKIAESNGINYDRYIRRVNGLGWSQEKAATTKVGKRKYSLELIKRAEDNGISYQRLTQRLRGGWSEEDASTIKPLTKAESGSLGHSRRTKNRWERQRKESVRYENAL